MRLSPSTHLYSAQWAIEVNGKWRLVIAYDHTDAVLVDYLD